MPDLDLTAEERVQILRQRREAKEKELRETEAAAGVFDINSIRHGMSPEERQRCLDAIRRGYGKRS